MEIDFVLLAIISLVLIGLVVLILYVKKLQCTLEKKSKLVDTLFKQNNALHKRLIESQENGHRK